MAHADAVLERVQAAVARTIGAVGDAVPEVDALEKAATRMHAAVVAANAASTSPEPRGVGIRCCFCAGWRGKGRRGVGSRARSVRAPEHRALWRHRRCCARSCCPLRHARGNRVLVALLFSEGAAGGVRCSWSARLPCVALCVFFVLIGMTCTPAAMAFLDTAAHLAVRATRSAGGTVDVGHALQRVVATYHSVIIQREGQMRRCSEVFIPALNKRRRNGAAAMAQIEEEYKRQVKAHKSGQKKLIQSAVKAQKGVTKQSSPATRMQMDTAMQKLEAHADDMVTYCTDTLRAVMIEERRRCVSVRVRLGGLVRCRVLLVGCGNPRARVHGVCRVRERAQPPAQ